MQKKDNIVTAVIIGAEFLVLGFAAAFLSKLGNIAFALIAALAIVLFVVTLLILRAYMRHMQKSAAKIEKFLTATSAGHLERRIEVAPEDPFSIINAQLNVTMENLERMSNAKNDFLSNMSHEIRTPMSAIVGMAQIGKNATDPTRVQDCLHKIEDNAKHLIGVINDILDYSKMEAGKLLLDDQMFSLKQNMDFIMTMFQGKVAEKNIVLKLSMHNVTNDAVVTDSLRLNQVLINLLSNAVKFTDAGGDIGLSVEEVLHINGESVYAFEVSDSGIGIEPEQAKKLFSPFIQASASTAKNYGGTGLGLVISKNIVEKMGGEIELHSFPGQGTTFRFTIRVESEEAVPESSESEDENVDNSPDFHGLRLLIVDDIEINREIALEILSDTGAEMETAENGKIALDMFCASEPGYYDLILMDMQMPVMGGCEATERIRDSGHADAGKVKIIAVTANVMRDDVKKALQAGMNSHIGKPIDFTEAYKVMSSLLFAGGVRT